FGFGKAVEALKLYGAGKQTPEVICAVTGLDVAGFDAAFQADLRARLAPYQGSFSLPSSEYADLDGLAEEAKRKPDDARVQALYGMALLRVAHDRAAADAQIKKALKLGPKSREGLYASAEVLLDSKEDRGALLLL